MEASRTPCRVLPKSKKTHASNGSLPRLSLPAFSAPKVHRTLHHRQSQPSRPAHEEDGPDILQERFVTIAELGKGEFSTVLMVRERAGEAVWAVKMARGFFDGVKDR